MQKDERDLLDVLKSELEFLEHHGYRRSPETAWRPKYIFEDSPSCINYDSEESPRPCTDCALIYLVPPTLRSSRSPCRHISLNESGETLDSLYRYGNEGEIESAVAIWLRGAITQMEEERVAVKTAHDKSLLIGMPLYGNHHPKCANPGCSSAFHWTAGGKFFRFRPDRDSETGIASKGDTSGGIHHVRHYWLCEGCTHALTLAYDAKCGVIVKLRWPEIAPARPEKASAA